MVYGIPSEVKTDLLPFQNLASLSDKSNRVQRWVGFLNAYTFTIKHIPKNANANADVVSRLPLSATTEDFQLRHRRTDPLDLDVYFAGVSGIYPSSLRTSSDSSLGGLANASGGLANVFGGLTATPDDVFFVGGGEGVACSWGTEQDLGAVRQCGGELSCG